MAQHHDVSRSTARTRPQNSGCETLLNLNVVLCADTPAGLKTKTQGVASVRRRDTEPLPLLLLHKPASDGLPQLFSFAQDKFNGNQGSKVLPTYVGYLFLIFS
jgi:hypothetical protein